MLSHNKINVDQLNFKEFQNNEHILFIYKFYLLKAKGLFFLFLPLNFKVKLSLSNLKFENFKIFN